MKILCVIPSRIGSTRLPRKALLPIQNKPMVQCVYENAKKCNIISRVIVATDSEEIAAVIHNCGGEVKLTPTSIATGTDRVAMVARCHPEMDIIINLQGDEPFIQPEMLQQLVLPFSDPTVTMSTLARPLESNHRACQDTVKVVTDLHNNALYFSRSAIPTLRHVLPVPVYHHIGLYAFRREFLQLFTSLPQTPLEKAEALEQLRVIEHGYRIRVCITTYKTLDVNTEKELARAQLFGTESILPEDFPIAE